MFVRVSQTRFGASYNHPSKERWNIKAFVGAKRQGKWMFQDETLMVTMDVMNTQNMPMYCGWRIRTFLIKVSLVILVLLIFLVHFHHETKRVRVF